MSDPRDLTTLDTVKSWLGLSSSVDDQLLTTLVTAVSVAIETALGRSVALSSYTETHDGNGGRAMVFAVTPVTTVTIVTVNDCVIPPAADACMPGYVFTPTRLSLQGYRFVQGLANVALSYSAGYAVIPPDLAQGATQLVALRYKERDRIGLGAHALAGESAAFLAKDMPPDVAAVIERYRKVVPL